MPSHGGRPLLQLLTLPSPQEDRDSIPRLGTASGRKKVLFLHRVFPYWASPWFLGSVYDWSCRPDQQGPRSRGCGSSSVLLEW